ncbi:unnamed protein product [Prunus brigantina]
MTYKAYQNFSLTQSSSARLRTRDIGSPKLLKLPFPLQGLSLSKVGKSNHVSQRLMLQKSIVVQLLDEFASRKATKDLGYLLALTTLETIGEGRVREHTGDVLFPVVFSGITFKLFRGEIAEGVVHKVLKHGVFLSCGPVENIYLSKLKMPDYDYVPGENPVFMNSKMSKIEKGSTVRFIVIGTKWLESEREFQALVGLHADYLGPVS